MLSGNRNFEGRINPEVRANYLASPPLVVAYALAGRVDIDLYNEPLGAGTDGQLGLPEGHLADAEEVSNRCCAECRCAGDVPESIRAGFSRKMTCGVDCHRPTGDLFEWDPNFDVREKSAVLRRHAASAGRISAGHPRALRVLALLGDSITTDHISPAGSIKPDSPAGRYLIEHGVKPTDFNSYGARRGNHEVMVRGTFANIRLRNRLQPARRGRLDDVTCRRVK